MNALDFWRTYYRMPGITADDLAAPAQPVEVIELVGSLAHRWESNMRFETMVAGWDDLGA